MYWREREREREGIILCWLIYRQSGKRIGGGPQKKEIERQRRMVGLLVFDSILVFFDTFYFTHKVIIHHLLYNVYCGTETLLLPLHIIITLSHLILNLNLTCIEPRERGNKTSLCCLWVVYLAQGASVMRTGKINLSSSIFDELFYQIKFIFEITCKLSQERPDIIEIVWVSSYLTRGYEFE